MKLEQYIEQCRKRLPSLLFEAFVQSPDDEDLFLGYHEHKAAELWINLDGEGGIYMHFLDFVPYDKQYFAHEIFRIVKDNITTVEFDDVDFGVFDNYFDVMVVPCLDDGKIIKDKVCYWRLHDGGWIPVLKVPTEDSIEFKIKLPLRKYYSPKEGFEISLDGVMYVVEEFSSEPDGNGVYDVWIVKK